MTRLDNLCAERDALIDRVLPHMTGEEQVWLARFLAFDEHRGHVPIPIVQIQDRIMKDW